MDVVELPSHFLEMFACDARVLAAFARHSGSGQAVPPRMATGLEAARRLDTVLELHQQASRSRQFSKGFLIVHLFIPATRWMEHPRGQARYRCRFLEHPFRFSADGWLGSCTEARHCPEAAGKHAVVLGV